MGEDAMREGELTTDGAPALILGGVEYPLVFSVGGMKRWADYKQMEYAAAIEQGWKGADLTDAEMRLLLASALRSGELRRSVFDPGSDKRDVGDDFVDLVLDVMHPHEVWVALACAWNFAPGEYAGPDPQTEASTEGAEPGAN
jgi:hypothetical protein